MKILIKVFKTPEEMNSTLIRLIEWSGEDLLTKEEYLRIFKEETGEDYLDCWEGFLLRKEHFLDFDGEILNQEESVFFNEIAPYQHEDFVVIALYEGYTQEAIEHEMAHIFWLLSKEYQQEMRNLIERHRRRLKPVIHYVQKHYDMEASDIMDEVAAYLSTQAEPLGYEEIAIDPELADRARKIWTKYKDLLNLEVTYV